MKLTLKIPADSAILLICIKENLWGKVVVATFLSIKIQKEDLTMTMGRRNDSIGSARQEHCAVYFVCQVVSHNNFKNRILKVLSPKTGFVVPCLRFSLYS